MQVTELAPLAALPAVLVKRKVLRPMATMAGGTMLAAALAFERGFAVNLGGGMHHACPDAGGGWCPYADIHLAIRRLRAASNNLLKTFMVVDLDVHQV
jgi:histone deacetylase 11